MTTEQREKVTKMICSGNAETRILGAKMSTSDIKWLFELGKRILGDRSSIVIEFTGCVNTTTCIEDDEYDRYEKIALSHNGKYYKYRKYSSYIGTFLIEEISKLEYEQLKFRTKGKNN